MKLSLFFNLNPYTLILLPIFFCQNIIVFVFSNFIVPYATLIIIYVIDFFQILVQQVAEQRSLLDQMKDVKPTLISLAGPDDAIRIDRIVQEDLSRFSLLNTELEMQFKHLDSIYDQSSQVFTVMASNLFRVSILISINMATVSSS